MRGSSRLLEDEKHLVHHAHSAGRTRRRLDGVKTPASRRFLSELKQSCSEFNDLPFRYCTEQLEAFRRSDEQLLFVHIREPEEIARFRDAAGEECRTLLVTRPALEQARGALGNRSDDGVAGYQYDRVFVNDGALDALPDKVHAFFADWLKDTQKRQDRKDFSHER